MKLTETLKLATLAFDNYTEAVAYAEIHASDAPNANTLGAMHQERDYKTKDAFYGTFNYKQAHALAVSGWKEGRDSVIAFKSKLDVTGSVQRPEIMFDVYGNCGFDMGRVLTGEPECMMDWHMVDDSIKSPKQVKMCVNLSCAAGVDTATIARRGAAIIGLIDALELAGVRVELDAVKINQNYAGESICIMMPIKKQDESLQIDQVAFALGHRSSNRRICFSLTHMCGQIGQRVARDGYGQESSYRPECDIFLGRLNHTSQFSTDEQAIEWIKAELVKVGVKLID